RSGRAAIGGRGGRAAGARARARGGGGRARAAPVDPTPRRRGTGGDRGAGRSRGHRSLPRPAAAAGAAARPHAGAPLGRAAVRSRRRPATRARALLPSRGARRGAPAPGGGHGDFRPSVPRPAGALTAQPLGVVLAGGPHELQLAAAAGARARARLRDLARGLPPGGARPLAALLGAARAALAQLPRGPRVAAPLRRHARAV